MAPAERQEAGLERRAGVEQRRPAVLEQRPEHLEAAPAATARANRLDRAQVEKPEPLGFVEAPLDLARPDHVAEVEQRPGNVVTGMPSSTVQSSGWRARTRWMSMPGRGWTERGAMTSIFIRAVCLRPHSAAASR